ncbi:enterochelin esterase [Streptomyces sp. NRRL F-5053]|uniref:enterochelin esterase n=1 Tax=Streptomyces sp. NRRL F-5053 TaxID=1463854 RepID=UPI00099D108D|nr:enterochelin esterase [Streptomyces sp. NRRL F-5053]
MTPCADAAHHAPDPAAPSGPCPAPSGTPAGRDAVPHAAVPHAAVLDGREPARGTPDGHSAAARRVPSPRIARLVARLAAHGADPAAHEAELARFWAEVADSGTPLVEPLPGEPEHRAVTFLWRGGPGTHTVLLLANRLIDRSDYTSGLLERVPGTDVWHLCYRLRSDHRGSYRIAADRDPATRPGAPAPVPGPGSGEGAEEPSAAQTRLRALVPSAVRDPLNPHTVATRWHGPPGSVFALPDAPPQPWAARRDGVARGTVARHRLASRALGAEREVWVRLPPRPWPAELDVLILLDGDMWFGQLGAEHLFDNLHADGAVRPLAVLAPHAVDNPTRMREFGGRQAYTDFLTEELLPWAAARLPLTADPARTTVAGQSLGGLTALYAGLGQRGDRVGNVIGQSPSLWWHPGVGPGIPPHTGEGEQWLTREFTTAPVRAGLRLRIDAGVHEGAMATMARALHTRLRERGYAVTHTEFNGGHDYVCWSGALADGLAALHTP